MSDRIPTALSTFRHLIPADQDQLWNWLQIALWVPPPAGLVPREVLYNPHISIYAENWGQPTDVGVVSQVDGVDAGACWMRLFKDGVGLGYVDDSTPQLGIALLPEFQHKVYGQPLMLAALDAAREAGYRHVSLTVHPENSAVRLYERCGFLKREDRKGYHHMVVGLGKEFDD